MDRSAHKSDFVEVNGLRLHYLDWGGDGPVLLFLSGMGCNAHIFDRFAARFTDAFRVLALTRRGHGESDHPESGYDIDTLTEDIRLFLDALHIDRAVLAGHSMAGVEMSHMAAVHPERLSKLIYLDAAFYRHSPEFKAMQEKNPLRSIPVPGLDEVHYSAESYFAFLQRAYPSLAVIWGEVIEEQGRHEIDILPDGKVVDRMTPAIEKALNETMSTYAPEDDRIRVPTLSFVAFPDASSFISHEYMDAEQQARVVEFFETTRLAWLQDTMEEFRRNVPQAVIVPIPHGHHYCFMSDEELVYTGMRKFLAS